MKLRDFKLDAWELCRQNSQPGSVALAEKAMQLGYSIGIKDANDRLAKALEELKSFRAKNNSPQ